MTGAFHNKNIARSVISFFSVFGHQFTPLGETHMLIVTPFRPHTHTDHPLIATTCGNNSWDKSLR